MNGGDSMTLAERDIRIARVGCGRISRNDCDAAPSGLHSPRGILAAGTGHHVIVKKPMVTSLAAPDALAQACDENGVKVFVVKQTCWNSATQLHFSDLLEWLVGRAESILAMTATLARKIVVSDAGVSDTYGHVGRKWLEVIPGTYEFAKTGRTVPLPLRRAL